MFKTCVIRVNVPTEFLNILKNNSYYIEVRVQLIRDERKTVGKTTVGDVIVNVEVIQCSIHVLRNVNWLAFTPVLEELSASHMAMVLDEMTTIEKHSETQNLK